LLFGSLTAGATGVLATFFAAPRGDAGLVAFVVFVAFLVFVACGATFATTGRASVAAVPRLRQLLTVVCGTAHRRAASLTPSSSAVARTFSRSACVYCRRFRGPLVDAMLVLRETSAQPQTVRGFRPRSPWTMFGNGR
jgi:hypothetical protein